MKVLLTQPNYSALGKRSWKVLPYALGVLNATIMDEFDTVLFDPNFGNLDDDAIVLWLDTENPDTVGISTISTEYVSEVEHMTGLIRRALPECTLIEGGVLPTVLLDVAMRDDNVDYWMVGEADLSLTEFLRNVRDFGNFLFVDGLCFRRGTLSRWEKVVQPNQYNTDLDAFPFANYGNLDFMAYSTQEIKYSQGLCSKASPHAVTITSRGCPYRCVFCSGPRISGRKVRMRSAANVLEEVDMLCKSGVKEITFLDDHFFFDRQRAMDIMEGLLKYNILWKCANLTIWLLDEEMLELMRRSGCYMLVISVESGDQYVVRNVVKKPIDLAKTIEIVNMAKGMGFDIISNFIIGFPEETWEQIRTTVEFASNLNVDMVNFHIATPLPNTELMESCIKSGLIADFDPTSNIGYTAGIIETAEFTPKELEILRAFEWDRINFSSASRREAIARIQNITLEELEQWRKNTRRSFGINVGGI